MFDFMDSVVVLAEPYKYCVGYAIGELYGTNRVSVRVFYVGGSVVDVELPFSEVMNLQPLLECNSEHQADSTTFCDPELSNVLL
jgi:hypothetical protein